MKKKYFLLLVFAMTFLMTRAAYFDRLPYTITQPDGKIINCFVSGDEFFNWIHDGEGYTLIQAQDGFYYYAEQNGDVLKPSIYKANSVNPASVGLKKWAKISKEEYKRRYEAMFRYEKESNNGPSKAPHLGTMNNLVVYIRFSDDTEFSTIRQVYDDMLNPSTGLALKSYFKEVSYDNLTISSSHYPNCALNTNLSFQDTHARSYFQPYNATTNPNGYSTESQRTTREHQLLADAVNWINVNSPVTTSLNIDGDGDNKVDNVCFIIKGNSGGWSDLLWAHRWALYSQYVYINGKRVYDYTFQPEAQVAVNVLCHEMFHALGAPDLYHYTNQGFITPVGNWDLMEYGFCHMLSYMKWQYSNHSWITTLPEITTTATYTLHPVTSSTNNCYKIASPYSSDEYFMVEYRNKSGTFESNIPGSGLIVYRIDTRVTNGNKDGPPDEVYIYRPGGTTTVNGDFNNANYSSTIGRTAINDATSPSCFLQNGGLGGLNISNVTTAGATISFDVTFPPPCSSPSVQAAAFTSSAITDTTMTVGWTRGNGDTVLVVAKNGSAVTAVPVNGTAYTAGAAFGNGTQLGTDTYVVYNGTGTFVNLTALTSGTNFYYAVFEYNASDHCYKTPALSGNVITTGYCSAGARSTVSYGEYISNVTIGTFNQSSGYGSKGYQNFTSLSATLQIGGSTSATISCTNSYFADQLFVWIDWNHDGDFTDTGEDVYSSIVFPFTNPQIITNLTPPNGAAIGNTRMRIRLDDADNGSNPNPCGFADWGEVEDYSINVIPAAFSTFAGTIDNDWNTAGNWDYGIPGAITNANIPANKLVIIQTNNNQCKNLTIAPLGKLTITDSKDLKVNGTLTLQSDISGTASLVDIGTLTLTTASNIERYISNDDSWHLLSAPVVMQPIIGQFAPTFCDNTFDFYKWDESIATNGNVWINLRLNPTTYNPAFENNFIVGKGYLVAYSSAFGNSTPVFSGNLNTGNIQLAVTKSLNTYNLIGNPYPSAIDWDSSGYTNRDIRLKNANPAIWVWNGTIGNYGVYTKGIGTNNVTAIIAPHQGFFVEAISSGTFTIPNLARIHPVQNFLKTQTADLLRLRVSSDSNNYSDEIIVNFNSNASASEGIAKWFSMITEAPSLFSVKNNNKLSINSFLPISGNLTVPIGYLAGLNGNYSLTATGLNSFSVPTYVYLKDLATNTMTDLNQNATYSFFATTSDSANRFQLLFALSPLSSLNNNIQQTSIYAYDNIIYIKSNENIQQIAIYNMLGQYITISANKNELQKISMNKYTNGNYIVRIITEKNVYAKKVFIK